MSHDKSCLLSMSEVDLWLHQSLSCFCVKSNSTINVVFPLCHAQEPSTKRVRPLGRVTSLANLISPVKNGAVRRFGQTLQASLRGDGRSPGVPQHKPGSKAAAPTPPKRRNSTLWSETLDVHQKGTFSMKEIKRQEVSTAKVGENRW